MGKTHGSINQAGKVRKLTPKVQKTSTNDGSNSKVRSRKNYNVRFQALDESHQQRLRLNPQE